MKLLPLLLAFILLLPEMHPCIGSFARRDVLAAETHACQAAEKHACCQFPAEEDRTPAGEDPCSEGCSCYCCVPVIAPPPSVSLPSPQLETHRGKRWVESLYYHEFTHLIWQPPQAG